jgi:hypothetical protein
MVVQCKISRKLRRKVGKSTIVVGKCVNEQTNVKNA